MEKSELFENAPVPRAVAVLSIPTIFSSLTMLIYNLADTFFVGMLNQPVQNAAVTLAAPVLLAFNVVNNLFGVGSSNAMSQAMGQKDIQKVRKSSVIGISFSLFCALMFSFLCFVFREPLVSLIGAGTDTYIETLNYLKWTVMFGAVPSIMNVIFAYQIRAEGFSVQASIGTMSGCILNIILDPIFVLPQGLGMGAEGAGLATFLSNVIACFYFLIFLWEKRKTVYTCVNLKEFSFDKEIIRKIFGIGIPASIQNFLNVTGMTVLNRFTVSYGTNAVAAMGIAQKINMGPNYFVIGLAQGIMPLIGYNYSAGNRKRLKEVVAYSIKTATVVVLIMAVGCSVFAKGLVGLFIQTDEIVLYGEMFLRGLNTALPFYCIDLIIHVTMQACSMNWQSLGFPILRKIILEIPALLLLNRLFAMQGLPYAQLCAEFLMACFAVWIYRKMFYKKETETVS